MKRIAIKPHKNRGNEIIKIFENRGFRNPSKYDGNYSENITKDYAFIGGCDGAEDCIILSEIAYLENPYIQENLAFSFQAQVAANEYYPGIARKIYLKAYRFNMHLTPKSMLIELGAQNNTVEEIMNACDPLAHILAIVLE